MPTGIYERKHRLKGDGKSKIYLNKDCTKYAVVDPEDYERICDIGHWCASSDGYAHTAFKKANGKPTTLLMHHAVKNFKYDPNVDLEIHHINRDKLDNRKGNLEPVTHQKNLIEREMYSNNKSGYKGIHWDKRAGKWMAQITVDGKQKYLGLFTNIEDAVKAYKEAELKYYGEKK